MRFLFLIMALLFTAASMPANALTPEEHFPRIANYYLKAGTSITSADFPALAAYDLLILPMEAQEYNKDFFAYARVKNPHIIILPYVPSRSINIQQINDGAQIRKRLMDGIKPEWYLRAGSGEVVSAWPGTIPLNVASPWNIYLPQFLKNTILSTGLWDGIFFDEVDDGVTHLNHGDIDLSGDGAIDDLEASREQWQQGLEQLFATMRSFMGDDQLLVTNGSSLARYQPYVNGRMFENFSHRAQNSSQWTAILDQQQSFMDSGRKPPIVVINANTGNTGKQNDYRSVRFGLASTLMNDGYFSFDYGDQNHGQLWNYDEFSVALGKPTTDAKSVNGQDDSGKAAKLYRRDFKQGMALVNPSSENAHIDFEEEFEKIHGTQDAAVNDGLITGSLDVAGHDGIIVLRPIDRLENIQFLNGSFARIFRPDGTTKRAGFFSYVPSQKGGVLILQQSRRGNGGQSTITATDKKIIILSSDEQPPRDIVPFGTVWTQGISFAVCPATTEGEQMLAVGPLRSATQTQKKKSTKKKELQRASEIRVFSMQTGALLASFEPFGAKYPGGVTVACADINNDGASELVVGAGAGSAPAVRVFSLEGKTLLKEFYAYDKKFRGGVSVAIGDIDGDGHAEIVTAPGGSALPQVKIFGADGSLISSGFLAFSKGNTSGVSVAVGDIDGDGRNEIVAMTKNVFTTSTLTPYGK